MALVKYLSVEKLGLLVILALTFVVFYPATGFELTNWDDNWMVANNPLIRSLSPANLADMFFGELYMLNYQPLIFLSFAIEYHFFGLDPAVFHFDNILLHIVNVLLVYLLFRQLSGNVFIAFTTAALFAIHPLRVESVAWVTTRRDLLYTIFYLLSLISYLKFLRGGKQGLLNKYLIGSLAFFVLSCMSKGMAVSLCLVLFLFDYIEGKQFSVKTLVNKIPFAIIALVFGITAIVGTHTNEQIELHSEYQFYERILFASYSFLFYIGKFIAPLNLSVIYPYPDIESGAMPFIYWVYFMVCIGLTAGVVYLSRKSKSILFGFGFFLFALIFVLQILPVGQALTTDRYTYLASLGSSFLLAIGINQAFNFLKDRKVLNQATGNRIKIILVSVVVLLLSFMARERLPVWSNSMSIWDDVIHNYPNHVMAHNMKGNVFRIKGKYSEALNYYEKAIELDSSYVDAYNNAGAAKTAMRKYDEAMAFYNKALSIEPDNHKVLTGRGTIRFLLGNQEAALQDFNRAIELSKENSIAYYNRGRARYMADDFKGALEDFDKAVALNSLYSNTYIAKGNSNFKLGNTEQACIDWRKAVEMGNDSGKQPVAEYCK